MTSQVSILRVRLHTAIVGYLVGTREGNNALIFSDEYVRNPNRPTFTLSMHPRQASANEAMSEPWIRRQKLHPVLSNLLPEGSLREMIAQSMKVHVDNEFPMLAHLGLDLPGAIVAERMPPGDLPEDVARVIPSAVPIKIEDEAEGGHGFSLAGVQMKFSMKAGQDGRYALSRQGELGDWIIKTPSTMHPEVPANEFTAMTLASLIGVEVPDMNLVNVNSLDNLPPINLPNESLAFAIRRFDRDGDKRVHAEDFAQVLFKYPRDKYRAANNEQIGRFLLRFSNSPLQDVQQMARRLLANILLANGDAHIKNWSLLYSDQINPRLSPAYDIVTTNVYMRDERRFALNLAGNKDWYVASYEHFERWSTKVGAPWKAIKPHLDDAMERARSLWTVALNELPMKEEHKNTLREHWQRLNADFRI